VFSPIFPPKSIKKRVARPISPGDASVITYKFGRACGIVGFVVLIASLNSYITFTSVINLELSTSFTAIIITFI
jgi:hypothetical protein